MLTKDQISKNLRKIKQEIEEAKNQSGRKEDNIILVAVSKLQPAEYIKWAIEDGHRDFGENYVQEALKKMEDISEPDVNFHFIGRCQTNKAKYIAGNFSMVHSVDSLKFAKELDKRCEKKDYYQDILIEVNVAKEETKGGVLEQDLEKFTEALLKECSRLKIKGLMCMPPYMEDPEKVRPYFAKLRKLKEDLEQKLKISLPHLSMGMSSDFKQAILEGATIVRIGTKIFGERQYKK